MLNANTKDLIDRIHKLTLEGKIEWREGDERNAVTFQADGMRVDLLANGAKVEFTIADEDGREIEHVEEEALSAVRAAKGGDYEMLMREIHEHARRIAVGADAAIARLMNALE